MKLISVTILCFILSACVSGVVDTSTDWYTLGERAALRGDVIANEQIFYERYNESDLASESFDIFQSGYQKGLISFCKVENAFQFGIKGGNYHGQCSDFPRAVEFNYEWSKAFQQFMFPNELK